MIVLPSIVIVRLPIRRVPRTKGRRILLCRTRVPAEDDCCQPRWHIAKWAKRKPPTCPVLWPGKAWSLWHYQNERGKRFTRVWSYVSACGSGHGYRAVEVVYGRAPTCKFCLKRIG